MAARPGPRAFITEIERFAVNDGPGIRTLVFIKGCPLRCRWCCNPETQARSPQLAYTRARCLNCGECVAVCPPGALKQGEGGLEIDRARCTLCGLCARQCASEALVVIGESMTAAEVFAEIRKDAVFFQSSGGGVTLSGGEPLASPRFARDLLQRCKRAGIHTALETCGHVSWKAFESVLPYVDLFLFDFKHADPRRHEEGTGVSNRRILENLLRLDRAGKEIVIRVPLIPGFNDSEDDLRQSLAFIARLGRVRRIDLLPYHQLGKPKYEKLGEAYPMPQPLACEKEKVLALKRIVEEAGYMVTLGG